MIGYNQTILENNSPQLYQFLLNRAVRNEENERVINFQQTYWKTNTIILLSSPRRKEGRQRSVDSVIR